MAMIFPQYELDRLERRKWILEFVTDSNTIGAELGVFRGHFSEVLIQELQPSKIYLVDLWRLWGPKYQWGDRSDSEYLSFGEMTPSIALNEVRGLIDNHPEIEIQVVEAMCENFLRSCPDKLDWVYLDTSHKYQDTKNELQAIDNTLKTGGIIMGDDWFEDSTHRHHGVYQAVQELLKLRTYELLASGEAEQWAIRKL